MSQIWSSNSESRPDSRPRGWSGRSLMALAKCKECGREVAKSAPACPNCGVKDPGKTGIRVSTGGGCLIIIVLFILFGLYVSGSPDFQESQIRTSPQTTERGTTSHRPARWAHRAVNVRSGRGTSFEIATSLRRGERVEVDSLVNGWYRIFRSGSPIGYSAASVLQAIPLPPIEVASWNWRKDPGFGTDGAIIWNVELRNNTDRYLDLVRVNLTTYDQQGRIVTSDFMYVRGLSPGGVASSQGYATYYGTETRARIEVGD